MDRIQELKILIGNLEKHKDYLQKEDARVQALEPLECSMTNWNVRLFVMLAHCETVNRQDDLQELVRAYERIDSLERQVIQLTCECKSLQELVQVTQSGRERDEA